MVRTSCPFCLSSRMCGGLDVGIVSTPFHLLTIISCPQPLCHRPCSMAFFTIFLAASLHMLAPKSCSTSCFPCFFHLLSVHASSHGFLAHLSLSFFHLSFVDGGNDMAGINMFKGVMWGHARKVFVTEDGSCFYLRPSEPSGPHSSSQFCERK